MDGSGEGLLDEAARGSPGRQLEALVAPLRFAVRDGFAGLPRLHGFGELVRGAVARARQAGAPDSTELLGLAAEGDAFEPRDLPGRRKAVGRIAAHLAALIPVPPELQQVARKARIEMTAAKAGAGALARSGKAQVAGAAPPQPSPRGGEGASSTSILHETAEKQGAVTPAHSLSREAGEGRRGGDERRARGASAAPILPDPPTPSERAERRHLLRTPLARLPKLHPAPRALLEERGYLTIEQALEFLPKGWHDRTCIGRIAELRPGAEGTAAGQVVYARTQRMRSGKPMLKVGVSDGAGKLELVFFNPPPWRAKQFAPGESLLATGKVTEGFGGARQMTQPEVEKLTQGDSANVGRIVPVYPGPADYQHPALRKLMKRLCDELAGQAVDDLPASVRARRRLAGRAEALRAIHFPEPGADLDAAAARATAPFRRLIFEELFFLQLALARKRQGVRAAPGIAFAAGPAEVARAVARLPFALTRSQAKVLDEIAGDMACPEPMNRLLQGDVGSGKTAVAFAAAMLAVESGYQVALMAPTEILAAQHARTLSRWLEGSGVELALVTAAGRGKGQKAIRQAVGEGKARIAIGTHALLEADVAFENLGLVVVDEQHRFGVLQRAGLIGKGRRPDVLVMTATPIPRTLALAFYGDLDQSKITELPPGRTPVETAVFGDSQRRKAHQIARAELEAGRQVYVVYPLVEESEKSDLADATSGAAEVAKLFAPHPVGLLHGKLKTEEKEAVMARFRSGELRILVATTVIEVGVDVPNASVMIVEHAERFGLSQLHQLRGRVGRGAARSHCLLIAHFKKAGDEARERLEAMTSTQDGFEIARVDLKLRGPGELLGTRQSGQRFLEVADLYRDEAILDEAREEATALVAADPELAAPEHAAAAEALAERWAERLSLAQVG
ncbi:MAG TPA: ATP-dependent DNA helicase RecG [Anaeromyxobacteraceae bacterium]|nr:ATP-dependent DNA helicase RecG [Anaeromyxobacteraceae bacterium]